MRRLHAGLLQNVDCVPDDLTNFMVQYCRTLSETVLKTIPQMVLQVNIYIYCAGNAGNSEGIDQEAGSALAQSLAVGGVCIVYRLVLVYYEMKEGLGLLGYLKSLVQLGRGCRCGRSRGTRSRNYIWTSES